MTNHGGCNTRARTSSQFLSKYLVTPTCIKLALLLRRLIDRDQLLKLFRNASLIAIHPIHPHSQPNPTRNRRPRQRHPAPCAPALPQSTNTTSIRYFSSPHNRRHPPDRFIWLLHTAQTYPPSPTPPKETPPPTPKDSTKATQRQSAKQES